MTKTIQDKIERTGSDAETQSELILLVGGDKPLQKNIEEILENYRLEKTACGKKALQKAKTHMPDLIICDLSSSEKIEYKDLRAIKEDEKLHLIPVIQLTSDASEAKRLEALETGADDYLVYPFNKRELKIRIAHLIRIHHQEKELQHLNLRLNKKLEKQREIIAKNERLTKFFPKGLLKWLLSLEKDVELKSERKRLTIFFSDLSGFTELAENTPAEEVKNLLNEYFTEMVKIVDKYQGTLDKFIGDGLMVFFGAPEPMEAGVQAINAVHMAVEMQMRVKELTLKWHKQGIRYDINVRMGIHQDYVMVGNFGASQVIEYSVFGSGVNLANRLESYCEPQKIMVSLPIYEHTRHLFPFSKPWKQLFRGFERLFPVSELDPDQIPTEKNLLNTDIFAEMLKENNNNGNSLPEASNREENSQ
ncbi:MAG: response regulator [bacterium]|nr:response regulator [bacterium]